ncbi:MAG: bis(5'-nucleosyl)-tetraphosphatase (symmetrical) YqeK [Anaerovoracaceae bacterium]|nr:bis(5'-nucleosyl)-tetraphosphatase (symmetrical) YqeK [Bacillota bacterium]MDY2669965.1 bis(5'-nucleosyl)-tetraphosphatase (symmetrical) YqeK [Anaerovoracaceae bacterium]
MDRELIKKLDEFIKVRLHEKRYRHTMGVVETATALADRYGADPDKTYIAALFHDACKNLDIEEMNSLVEKYHLDEVYIDKPQLAHSKLAAEILQDKFGITDQDIINAVSYHTTGRANMSLLEKIIFVADAVEPNRTYPEAKTLNKLAFEDIDRAGYEISSRTINRVEESGMYLDRDSIEARDWFESILKGDSLDNSRNFAVYAANVLDSKKAEDIIVLDIAEKSSFADYLVISSGGSFRQVSALAEAVQDRADMQGRFVRGVEGKNGSGWVLMDYGDVVINIFTPEKRDKYNLEKIWSDCERVDWEA